MTSKVNNLVGSKKNLKQKKLPVYLCQCVGYIFISSFLRVYCTSVIVLKINVCIYISNIGNQHKNMRIIVFSIMNIFMSGGLILFFFKVKDFYHL